MSRCGNDILLIVSILGVVFMLSTYTESFINPGSYPDHVTKPLLAQPHGDFQLKQEPKFIKVNAAEVNAEEIKSSYKLFSKFKYVFKRPRIFLISKFHFSHKPEKLKLEFN